jgi:ATP-binding cassette subfamily F protein uup
LPPVISAQGLSKRYGATPLFQNISFTVSEGDRIGVIGPNGSGKSTLLEMLIGRSSRTAGCWRSRNAVGYGRRFQFATGVTVRGVIECFRAAVPGERASRFAETLGRAGVAGLG